MQIETYNNTQAYRSKSSSSAMSTSQINSYNNLYNFQSSNINAQPNINFNQSPINMNQTSLLTNKQYSAKLFELSSQIPYTDTQNKGLQLNSSYTKLRPQSLKSENQLQYLKNTPTVLSGQYSYNNKSNYQSSSNDYGTRMKQNNNLSNRNYYNNNFSYMSSPSGGSLIQQSNISGVKSYNPVSQQQIDRNYLMSKQLLANKSSDKQLSINKELQYSILKIQNENLKKENKKYEEVQKKLRKQLQQKVQKLQQFNKLMKIKYNQIKQLKQSLSSKQSIISQLQQQKNNSVSVQQANKLKCLLFQKNNKINQIQQKINNLQFNNFSNQLYQNKIHLLYNQIQSHKNIINSYLIQKSQLNQKITQLQQKLHVQQVQFQKSIALSRVSQVQSIQKLFKQNQQQLSPTKYKQSTHLTAFEQALKVQMKQIQQLKSVIDNNTELVHKLKDNLINSRRQLQQLRNQMKIIDLKTNSQRKKLIQQYRLQIHEKDNEINSSLKRYKTLQQKYKNALLDIKAKDDFFKQHLVGRVTDTSIHEYIQQILNKYTESFEDLIALKTQNSSLLSKLQKYQQYQKQLQ